MNEAVPPMVKVKAIDVRPFHWALWCRVGDYPSPIANEIVARKWSDDGEHIWFMLDTHNFLKAKPDEEIELIQKTPAESVAERYAAEDALFLSTRPVPLTSCPHVRSVAMSADRLPISRCIDTQTAFVLIAELLSRGRRDAIRPRRPDRDSSSPRMCLRPRSVA